jgi:hypothetical protein
MKKSRIEKLIPIANEALLQQYNKVRDKAILRKDNDQFYIKSNYDGKVSGFGVSVALSGLRPALVMYYNESGDVKTRPILEILAKIIVDDGEYKNEIQTLEIKQTEKDKLLLTHDDEQSLIKLAIKKEMNAHLHILKKYVIEAITALKQVIRTYELK